MYLVVLQTKAHLVPPRFAIVRYIPMKTSHVKVQKGVQEMQDILESFHLAFCKSAHGWIILFWEQAFPSQFLCRETEVMLI